LPYRRDVVRVVAVGVEPQATTEARRAVELILGHWLDEVDGRRWVHQLRV
jgi:hypothetical protein